MAGSGPTEKQNTSQWVGFRLAEQAYAFRIEQIQEIVILDKVTRTPQVPDYCDGVSNLRGAIIPIINLRKLFGLDSKSPDAETRTIVVNVGEKTMGCTVDTVSEVVRISEQNIQPAPETVTSGGAEYITGFARLEEQLVVLLDINELLKTDQLERVKRASLGKAEETAS